MSPRVYHVCGVRLDGRQLLFLWFTNGHDGIQEISPGRIRTFPSADSARTWGRQEGVAVAPDPTVWYDLEEITQWCQRPTAEGIDCVRFLDVWNLLGDLNSDSASIFRGADRRGKTIYDKLFFGSNLPSVTPSGDAYSPTWSEADVRELARVLRLGLAEFRHRVSGSSSLTSA
jgi:hypothetical protein